MGFSCKVDNSMNSFENFRDNLLISNIAMNKFIARIIFNVFQVIEVARISQLILIDDFASGIVLQKIVNEITADKTCSSCN